MTKILDALFPVTHLFLLKSKIPSAVLPAFQQPLNGHSRMRSEFRLPRAFTTIFFVSSNAYYVAPSDDPIFPSVINEAFFTKFGPLAWNNLQRDTMLGCADSLAIRHPRSKELWFPYFSPDDELERPEWADVRGTATLLNLSALVRQLRPPALLEHLRW